MDQGLVAGAADVVRRGRAIAEFEEWAWVVAHHARRVAEIDRTDDIVLSKELARREVTLDLAQSLRVTEHHVWSMIREAQIVQERTPTVWRSFQVGDIDAVRVTAIADTAARLTDPKSWQKLEHSAPEYAATHTIAELRAWLRRLRRRLEPDEGDAETTRALADRRVSITHNDDGTSWLNALLPTPVAIAVGERLRTTAKTLPAVEPRSMRPTSTTPPPTTQAGKPPPRTCGACAENTTT